MCRRLALAAAVAVLSAYVAAAAADTYPRTLVAKATAASGATQITADITIHIDRLIEPSRRQRVLDGLKYDGYQGFMRALRPLPVIGSIATQTRSVKVQYAWESRVEDRLRLIVVADKPLFFLPNEANTRAGYELTFVELLFDEHGAASGTMSGAARVKPAPDSGIVLGDFAATPVTLTIPAPVS
jgi:hypothetical protein